MAHKMYLFGDIEQIMEDLQREWQNAVRLEALYYYNLYTIASVELKD